jgi:hypothetical protein
MLRRPEPHKSPCPPRLQWQGHKTTLTFLTTTLGFLEVKSDTSLFIFRHGSDTVYLLLYVDDIILTHPA